MAYATRRAVNMQTDRENPKAEGKAPAAKGAAVAGKGAAAQNVASRKALGDIGNLVTGMNTRCHVKGDAEEVDGNHGKVAAGPTEHAGGAGGAARKFGTNLNNARPTGPTTAGGLPDTWGTRKRRSINGVKTGSKDSAGKSGSCSEVGSSGLPPGGARRRGVAVASTRVTRANKEAQKGTTATLCDRSQDATHGNQDAPCDEMREDGLPDIDSVDKDDILHVTEYVEDIYAYYKKTEGQSVVPVDYMAGQQDINEKMRAILIDWLIEVHLKFKLMPETIFLTVNVLDRFLSMHQVSRKNLQLVGVTAMLVASKYEETWAPEVKDFVYISDNAYNKDEILSTERIMLNTLKFNMTVPTPYVFLSRFLKAANAKDDPVLTNMTYFFAEVSLPEYVMVKFSPSHVAAAALYAAKYTINKEPPFWNKVLERHSGYTEDQLSDCCNLMILYHQKSTEQFAAKKGLTAVHKKYSQPRFCEVAKYKPADNVFLDDCISASRDP